MEIAVLSSSRADFGFYRPLLNLIKNNNSINASLVVFGSHLSKKHGLTVDEIKASNFKIFSKIYSMPKGDSPEDIAKSIGDIHIKFAEFWNEYKFDLILCLGDRYEMFAAVSASVPFNIPVAHISGGEETLGAIDNIYRHSLSLMSKYHFTNTKGNSERLAQILGSGDNIFHTGSLAIDNIKSTKLFKPNEFEEKFNFNITQPFILFTFHPETFNYQKNENYANVIKSTLSSINVNVLITMPNADTNSDIIRNKLIEASKDNANLYLVESLGSKGYYTALKKCIFVLGNSSSGIVEAASFGKYVINLGRRQQGREAGDNVINCDIVRDEILNTIENLLKLNEYSQGNIYGDGKASGKILKVLSNIKV